MREVIEVTDNENQVHVFTTFSDLIDYANTCGSMGWLPDGFTWKITNEGADNADVDEELEIVRCENGVGEWEIYPTGETFDTRREAEARLKEIRYA